MILEEITTPGWAGALAASRTVIIPFGSLEEHGPHLPLVTDTLQAVEVCRVAAARAGVHLAPAVAYGVCRSTAEHPGTVGVTTATLRSIAVDLVRAFHRQGMLNFMLVSGHAGQTHVLTLVDAGEQLIAELPRIRVSVVSEYREAVAAGLGIVETEDDSHAGEIETARVMALRPELVQGTAPAEWPRFPHALLVRDKVRHWPGGVWGDPGKATPEKGRLLLDAAADRLVELIRELETWPDGPARGSEAG